MSPTRSTSALIAQAELAGRALVIAVAVWYTRVLLSLKPRHNFKYNLKTYITL